jgi:O-methyltransferase
VERFLDPLTNWPCQPPHRYRGQLVEAFQKSRAAAYSGIGLEDCSWYHTTELPNGTVLDGQWDLRQHEQDYLGRVPLAGQTVLEFGPASGYLTFYMESRGARVTAFEAGYDATISMVPAVPEPGIAAKEAGLMEHTRRNVNAWWYLHRTYGSAARLVHGDIYHLPDDLDQYDIVVLGSILLHCRDFAAALEQACRHARTTVVIAEPLRPDLDTGQRLVSFVPDMEDPAASVTWWGFSPGAIVALLWRLGFASTNVVRHTQRYRFDHGDMSDVPYVTIVARRMSAGGDMRPPHLMTEPRGRQTRHSGQFSALLHGLYARARRR